MVRFYISLFYIVAFFHNKKRCPSVALSTLHLMTETFRRHLQKYISFSHEISFVLVPLKFSCGIQSLFLRSFQIQVWKICDFCTQFSKSLQRLKFWISVKFHLPTTQFMGKCAAGTREVGTITACSESSETVRSPSFIFFQNLQSNSAIINTTGLSLLQTSSVWFSSFFHNHFSTSFMGFSLFYALKYNPSPHYYIKPIS